MMSDMPPQSPASAQPDIPQISGANALALVLNLRVDLIRPLLVRYGLNNIDPNKWYDQQQVLNVFKDMAEMTYEDFVAVGMKAADTVQMPPEINSVESVLSILPHAYQLNHRNIPQGEGYSVRKINETHYQIEANTPYPVYVIYGVIYGLVRKYSAGEGNFQVALKSESPLVIDVFW